MIASVIIPVADDSRNAYLDALLSQLAGQSLRDFEVILVIGDNRQGRAINQGARAANGNWIIVLDDDTHISDNALLQKLVAAMERDATIGLGGAACVIPDWATAFQERAMRQIPRRFFPEQTHDLDSDFVQHPCLIISRDLFLRVGGEDEQLIRGLDPILRKKVRDAGFRVTIIANTAVVHLVPDGWRALMGMYRRNGRGSAFAYRFYPERIVELTNGYDRGTFVQRRGFGYRVARRIKNLLTPLACGHWVRVAVDLAYSWGWLEEFCSSRFPGGSRAVRYTADPVVSGGPFPLRKFRAEFFANSSDEQIARLHVSSDLEFVLGDTPHAALPFFRDKVALFRLFAPEGILVELDETGNVVGFLLLLLSPPTFHRTLVAKGYSLRYLLAVLSGRYRGSPEGWLKWLRLPVAFVHNLRAKQEANAAKVVALIVREDTRGQGLGRKLLERAEALARDRGKECLLITVNRANEEARALYERFGFQVVGDLLESTGPSYLMRKDVA